MINFNRDCGKKGFVFTLDALFAVIIVTSIIGTTFFMLSSAQRDYFRERQMSEIANDALVVFDKLDILETHNKTSIKYAMIENLPTNYGARLRVTPYECSGSRCTGFIESSTVPQYEIIKGLQTPVDAIMIIDRSSSMADNCPGWAWWCTGGITDAKEASKSFLDYLYFEKDRAGLVTFGDAATLDQTLTSDKGTLISKIDAIDAPFFPIQQTAMGDGIDMANQEFQNNGRPNAEHVSILLSDGQNNMGQDPLDAAQDAADDNITIYTIGLGSDADGDVLGTIANMTGGKYYYSPSGSELESIYAEIAMEIFRISREVVTAKRSFLTFENNRTKYYCIAEIGVWLI